MEQGMPLPVVITVYSDRSFTFIVKTPPTSYFLKKAAKVNKSEEHTSELQSLMRISYAVFCLKKTNHAQPYKRTYKLTRHITKSMFNLHINLQRNHTHDT